MNEEEILKTQSPGAMTAKRFLRNRLAVTGLVLLGLLFLFSFLGGWLSPYRQDQVFYRDEPQLKEFAGVSRNESFRFAAAPGQEFGSVLQAQFALKLADFTWRDTHYTVNQKGQDLYTISAADTLIGIAYKDIVTPTPEFTLLYDTLLAYTNGQTGFSSNEIAYTLLPDGTLLSGTHEIAYISRTVIQSRTAGTTTPRQLHSLVDQAIDSGTESFSWDNRQFQLVYDAANRIWSLREATATRVWDAYAAPSRAHPLGTDKNGMDVLTRLMYGGRVSLVIGFIVVFISALLGVVLGGTAGYFGGWTDNLIMRLVDIFYCVPSTPLLIILGAVMDAMRLDPRIRMLYLMLILGLLGWPSIARLVRGQILSLREQEFMTAAEAAGLRTSRRIFRHLIPNVIPQLIVTCTMSLGSTILTEATLSFLGLGVKFPFASWGNIMNDVSNAHVLTSYWFVWIPAGVCLVLAVLGFNFVGDGLRDAFDPKMKR